MPESLEWRPSRPSRGRLLLAFILLGILLFSSRTALSYYVDLLWFGSLGYADVFRKSLRLQWEVMALFTGATFFILYGWFLALRRAYQADLLSGSVIFIGGHPLKLPVERILRLIVLVVSLLIAVTTGAGMMAEWPTFAFYWYAPQTGAGVTDPIFGRPLHFYLFTLPAWQLIAGWLLTLAVVCCGIAVLLHSDHRRREDLRRAARQFHPIAVARLFHSLRILPAGARHARLPRPLRCLVRGAHHLLRCELHRCACHADRACSSFA